MSDVAIGVVGAGVIGTRHIKTLLTLDGVRLVGIADPSPSEEARAVSGNQPIFETTQALIDAAAPDGVIVATPTDRHLAPALAALSSGVDVLIEKPIAATDQEADLLIEAAERTGQAILIGHHRRHYRALAKAQEIIQSGVLGQIVLVSGVWALRKHDEYYAPGFRNQRTAGPVLINLTHEIDLIRALCGEIESVSAELSNAVRGTDKEDAAAVIVRFQSGALGTFAISDQANSPFAWEFATGETPQYPRSGCNTLKIMGTAATLDFPNLTLWQPDGPPEWRVPQRPEPIESVFGNAFADQLTHFAAVIRREAAPLVSADDGARTLAATTAVFEAADSGRRVFL
ncbi:MAG: Gfo/Idh/MocA family oxidoreductase [Pseudomonadota bacterium]